MANLIRRADPNHDDYRDFNTPFFVDDVIERLARARSNAVRLLPHCADIHFAKSIARRAVESATEAAAGSLFDNEAQKDTVEAWSELADKIDDARTALEGLTEKLMLRKLEKGDGTHQPDIIAHTFRQISSKSATTKRVEVRYSESVKAAEAAIYLAKYLKTISRGAQKFAATLREQRQNQGNPVKREFVMVMAEAWVFLTGKIPGISKTVASNPFASFVVAAWSDASKLDCETEEDFGSAINSAVRRLLLRAEAADLVTYTPDWL